MASAAQILANQANARLSTGPRSAEGKARSALNSRSHGLFSSVDALQPLERQAYDALCEHLTRAWGPATSVSLRLVEHLALAQFRLERVRAIQFQHLAQQVQALCEAEALPAPSTLHQQAALEARVYLADAQGPKLLGRFHRYEQSFLREIRRLEAELVRVLETEERPRAEPPPSGQNEPIAAASKPRPLGNLELAACPGAKIERKCQNEPQPRLPRSQEDRV